MFWGCSLFGAHCRALSWLPLCLLAPPAIHTYTCKHTHTHTHTHTNRHKHRHHHNQPHSYPHPNPHTHTSPQPRTHISTHPRTHATTTPTYPHMQACTHSRTGNAYIQIYTYTHTHVYKSTHIYTHLSQGGRWQIWKRCGIWAYGCVMLCYMTHSCVRHDSFTCVTRYCGISMRHITHGKKIRRSHVTHKHESCDQYRWVMPHTATTYEPVMSHVQKSYITHMNESCFTRPTHHITTVLVVFVFVEFQHTKQTRECKNTVLRWLMMFLVEFWETLAIWIESWHAHACIMPHICMSHGTHMHASCPTYVWVMVQKSLLHVSLPSVITVVCRPLKSRKDTCHYCTWAPTIK